MAVNGIGFIGGLRTLGTDSWDEGIGFETIVSDGG